MRAAPVLALALVLASGCYAEAGPLAIGGYATVYATSVPPNIYDYPSVYYDGGYAYFADGLWYYPSRRGWVVFRHEPAALWRYRAYVQQAPPARPYYRAPPAYAPPAYGARPYYVPPVNAPPAYRPPASAPPAYGAQPPQVVAPQLTRPAAPSTAAPPVRRPRR